MHFSEIFCSGISLENLPTVDHAYLNLSMFHLESDVTKLRGVQGHHEGHIGEEIGWLH